MASSGSFSGSIRDGHYKLRVDWSQSKNVSANTSTITCKLYLVNDWSLNISGRSDNTCTIDGSAQTFSSPAISSTGTHLLGTVSRTVNHASDGSKSLTISAVFQIRATLSVRTTERSRPAPILRWTVSPVLQCIRREHDAGICREDQYQSCFLVLYAYADLFLWKYQRDNCNKDHINFGFMDTGFVAGQPDPECDQRYLHHHLYDLQRGYNIGSKTVRSV